MTDNKFILTKEHLMGWLSDSAYMEEYRSQVYNSILQFYFDTFFASVFPAKRAILEIEKDLGIPIEKEKLLSLFYSGGWSRKKKKQKMEQQDQQNQKEEIKKEEKPSIVYTIRPSASS